ncbi:PIR Superfamily Protein [Plasmodium ovale wallikeri]|uniref:PIR protein n=2 Tax=Plasmodium ovale TaxID=36330 RepID=A0A1C3KJE6_PLAOA|nr:PIR Superfamily Protein [Plasmodium ovale wallikeri]SBT73990.1 PIR protein [Plasmodium ovale]SBT74635.1 PIR protein [Plasmodium ovale]
MYNFCINSPYYEMVVENIKRVKDVKKIEDACNSFSNNACSFENESGKGNCIKFICMYKFLNEAYRTSSNNSILTHEDFDFLNYWLNVILKGKDIDASNCISEFDKVIETQVQDFISSKTKLRKRFHVIDPGNLENMELLYDLYDNSRNILNMMRGQDYPDEEKANEKTLEEENKCIKKESEENECEEKESEVKEKEKQRSCLDYTKDCSTKYKKAMDNCLNDNDDFYKALKAFKINYIAIEEENQDLKDCKSSPYFYLPEYDPVLERKQKKIMLIQNITTSLMVLLIIPLLYKFTPFGSFLREKIRMVKDKWVSQDQNGDELLSLSTDIEDDNSDNVEYNIGYYSGTN